MSYEIYKLIHLLSIFLFIGMAVKILVSKEVRKIEKIALHSSGFFIFVAGMGLIARIGISHGEGWPLWIKAKVALWAFLFAIFAIMHKKIIEKKFAAWPVVLGVIITLAAYFAINKP